LLARSENKIASSGKKRIRSIPRNRTKKFEQRRRVIPCPIGRDAA